MTRAGGRVDIMLTSDGDEFELSVTDAGVGIDASDADADACEEPSADPAGNDAPSWLVR